MIAIGRRVYSLGAIGLGIVQLAYGAFDPDWLPVPAHTPGYAVLVYASASLLVLAGLVVLGGRATNAPRTAAASALALAALFASLMLVFEAPSILARPTDWGGWQAVAESTAMAMGGLLAYARSPGVDEPRGGAVARAARLVFGLCLLVFGVSHFVYARFTAALVPAWLPPSQRVWAYATGAAQIAAGLAALSGVLARPAAILLTAMYVGFGLLVHLPSVIAAPSSQANWTENAINLILVGVAWTLADGLSAESKP